MFVKHQEAFFLYVADGPSVTGDSRQSVLYCVPWFYTYSIRI